MNGVLIHLKKLDWVLIITVILLVSIGLLSIYSSSLGQEDFLNFKKQLIFFGLGFILMFLLSFFDWRNLREDPYLILVLYILTIVSLAGLYFFGEVVRGTRAWYRINGISFSPIEFTKIILIILLAKYFSMRHIEMYRFRHIILSGIYILVPSLLVFFQPDLGSVLILLAFWAGVLLMSGIKVRHFVVLLLLAVLIFILSWSFLLKDYQKERIISFINPQLDPEGISWNINQSKIAIGSGGILGRGIGKSSQVQYGFLPEPQTDFIFAAIAEELGLIGVTILLFLLSMFLWRIIKMALLAENNFSRLFASGFAIIVGSQSFINIGMNLGILPIIGIPLPFVSYGGSGLLAMFIGLGILQSLKSH